MQTLHFITPSHFATSDEVFGLMRLAQKSLGGEHRTIVLGSQKEATWLRQRGIKVLGSIDGILDVSNTLSSRLRRMVMRTMCSTSSTCIAWGWHAASTLSTVSSSIDSFAYVDEIDEGYEFGKNNVQVIPSGWSCSRKLVSIGIDEQFVAEPLLGVEPTSMVVDRATVFDAINIPTTTHVIPIVGRLSSWQEILSMLFRLDSANREFVFVLPDGYNYSSELRSAVKQRGLSRKLIDLPPALRSADVLANATCAWAPEPSSYDESHSVLEVVTAAWGDMPVAANVQHPVADNPCFGAQIAWAASELEICGWILDIIQGNSSLLQKSAEVTMSVRSIASPSRFIEGMQLRMSTQSVS